MVYPWYEIVNTSSIIHQGDFIPDCPIIIPPSNIPNANEDGIVDLSDTTLECKFLNTVVLSQSCDLEFDKIDIVLVCPVYGLEEFFEGLPAADQTTNGRAKKCKDLKQGHLPSFHVLNRDTENGVEDFKVVSFSNVYGINLQYLKTYASTLTSRVRLLPPYREHLSQAFARFFMRVGLPNDISDLQ